MLFSGEDGWTQKVPEVRDDGLLVESGHSGRPVDRTDLQGKASSAEGTPSPPPPPSPRLLCTHHMLYFGRHGYKLVRLLLAILGDELHVGDTEHPGEVHAAVAFPAD